MSVSRMKRWAVLAAGSAVVLAAAAGSRGGDDPPSRLGRLFRLGGNSRRDDSPAIGKSAGNSAKPAPPTQGARPFGGDPSGASLSPYGAVPPSTPTANRIVPQPRDTRAATEADPLVTRVSIGRSDDGKQFCMFIQIFADGTVMDSEGVHRVGPAQLRPIAELLQAGDLAKLDGHCGGPSTDFIEQVHVVAFDRFRGKLRATPFSFSGNGQGCDPSVRELNAAIDAIQMKLTAPTSPSLGTGTGQPIPPPLGGSPPPPIGLTPER